MKYFIRINGEPDLQAGCNRFRKDGDNTITIRDTAPFPLGAIPDGTLITKIQLVDEAGEEWAMRRFEKSFAPVARDFLQMTFNWTLTVTRSGKE